jgi:ATP-binding cassette, subfamily B, multidrug efflux pump
MIVLAIALLFIQANCDLALPDYMSKIVNNGIQQSGVENAVPKAIRANQMSRLQLMMSSEQQQEIAQDYRLLNQDSSDYAA